VPSPSADDDDAGLQVRLGLHGPDLLSLAQALNRTEIDHCNPSALTRSKKGRVSGRGHVRWRITSGGGHSPAHAVEEQPAATLAQTCPPGKPLAFPRRRPFGGSILVDQARRKRSAKRASGGVKVPLEDVVTFVPGSDPPSKRSTTLNATESVCGPAVGRRANRHAGASRLVDRLHASNYR
jgi:hypothetical protein